MSAKLGESLKVRTIHMHPTHGEPRYLLADVTGRLPGPHEDRKLSPARAIGNGGGQNDLVCGKGVVPRGSAFVSW